MSATYEPISTTTGAGGVSSITFSSVPQTYTDLILVVNGSVTPSDCTVYVQFNSDTNSNYSAIFLSANGSTRQAYTSTNDTGIFCGRIGSNTSTSIIQIYNYSNTTTYKGLLSRGNNPSASTTLFTGTWRNTSAINTIKVYFDGAGNFNSTSTFTLFGIKAA